MPRHVPECEVRAVRGIPAKAASNRAAREYGTRGRVSPRQPPLDRTKSRDQLRRHRPPSPPQRPKRSFHSATYSAASSAAAASPLLEKEKTRRKLLQCLALS